MRLYNNKTTQLFFNFLSNTPMMPRNFTLIIFIILNISAGAQDVHFAHFHATPMQYNPALTGVFDGVARVAIDYRNQWREITADYKTSLVAADFKLGKVDKNSIIGMGIQYYSDKAGDLDFTTNSFKVSASWMQALNRRQNNFLIGSLQIGRGNQRFDASKAVIFDDEPLLALNDPTRNNFLDMGVGVLWYSGIFKQDFVYLGAAIYHFNQPNVSFTKETVTEMQFQRFVLHGGANLSNGREFAFMPSFIWMDQGPHKEISFGSFVRYNSPSLSLNGDLNASVMVGAWMRMYMELDGEAGVDAAVGAVRYNYGPLFFTFSYDLNISSLSRVSFGRGGPEFSVVYIVGGDFNKNKKDKKGKKKKRAGAMSCPHF